MRPRQHQERSTYHMSSMAGEHRATINRTSARRPDHISKLLKWSIIKPTPQARECHLILFHPQQHRIAFGAPVENPSSGLHARQTARAYPNSDGLGQFPSAPVRHQGRTIGAIIATFLAQCDIPWKRVNLVRILGFLSKSLRSVK